MWLIFSRRKDISFNVVALSLCVPRMVTLPKSSQHLQSLQWISPQPWLRANMNVLLIIQTYSCLSLIAPVTWQRDFIHHTQKKSDKRFSVRLGTFTSIITVGKQATTTTWHQARNLRCDLPGSLASLGTIDTPSTPERRTLFQHKVTNGKSYSPNESFGVEVSHVTIYCQHTFLLWIPVA